MSRIGAALALSASILLSACATTGPANWSVASDRSVGGFKFPESAAYDPAGKVLYVGNFGGDKLDPAGKTGTGYLSKVSLDGKVLEERWAPAAGETMNKPKGIWIQGNRLWVTDIDAVWIFDLQSKKGRRLALPGVGFANDPAVMGGALYVSDNRNDKLVKVEPADFLAGGNPSVTEVFAGQKINPNGVYPSKSGSLIVGGFVAPDQPKPLYSVTPGGQVKPISDPIGRIDGLYEMADGSFLLTNWDTSSLSHWRDGDGTTVLAGNFKGPADFTVIPVSSDELTVVVPDLPGSQLRFITLRKR